MTAGILSALRPRRYQLYLPLKVWIRNWGNGGKSPDRENEVEEETITQNISSSGCYFLLSEEPKLGSQVEMEIQMSSQARGQPESMMVCRGRVVRVEKKKGQRKAGVGCAIEHYRIQPFPKDS